MKTFTEKEDILCTSQYGFRQGHSPEHASLDIVNEIQSNVDEGLISCGVFIDLQKIFDTVAYAIFKKLDFMDLEEEQIIGFLLIWDKGLK